MFLGMTLGASTSVAGREGQLPVREKGRQEQSVSGSREKPRTLPQVPESLVEKKGDEGVRYGCVVCVRLWYDDGMVVD